MALPNLDAENIQEELDLGDYNVIPRPQELIDLQKQSSRKPKLQDKYGHGVPKKFSEVKEAAFKRLIEKKESFKLREKLKERAQRSSKSKPPYKSSSSLSKKKYASNELENKFESFVKSAMSSVSKQKSDTSKAAASESADQPGNKDVQKIMLEPATTPQRKFEVLDTRDNNIRSNDSKQSGSKKSKVLGCCPDMCPEKERYHRIAKNCLSPLELKFALDHNLSREDCHRFMIKEYSRSSADQQEPLPHELRPISVLKFTMDYLLCNVMDIPLDTVTLADWYDFIWNRTRSIRKDITQQQLCDITCVEIIEKCVRFHIHCAEALSEEDTSIFDPKINNENLTKGLQTLKHMYYDLESRGIRCPNEAEFRSYDILLSLTEGETLRLVKDIRKDLLKSSKVRSAFEAALAFKSNNYVKFFNIIEKADYLSSCILHRYISEARRRALQIIVRAYSTQNNATMYPTSSLLKDLKFESLSDACDFCKCHGLESNEDYITIQRQQFTNSPSGLPICRSLLLVGNKKNKCLGEVINNENLSANPLDWYKPHDSFNEKNILKTNSLGITAKEDVPEIKVIDTVEEMETDETSTEKFFHTESPIPEPVVPSEKSTHFEYTDIQELEMRRKKLLSEINKLQSYNTKNLKDVKSIAAKVLLKNKKDFSTSLVSVPHKSIMFSSEDSSSSLQEQEYNKSYLKTTIKHGENKYVSKTLLPDNITSSDNFIKAVRDSSSQDSKTSEITAKESFFKTSISVASSVFSLLPACSPLTRSQPCTLSQSSPQIRTKPITVFGEVKRNNNQKSFPGSVSPLLFDKKEDILRYESPTDHVQNTLLPVKSAQFSFTVHSPLNEKSLVPSEMVEDKQVEEVNLPQEETDSYYNSFQYKEKEHVHEPAADLFKPVSEENEEFDKISNAMIEQEREEQLKKIAEDIAEELYTECVYEYSVSICEEVFNNEKIKKALMEDEFEMIKKNLGRKVILKWKYFCERKRQRRIYEKSTLCSPWQPMLLNTPYVRTGVVNPITIYKKQCILSRNTAEKIKQMKTVPPGWEEFKPDAIWENVQPYLTAYFGKTGFLNFFKLCIIFPVESDSSDFTTFSDWMCTKFSLPRTENFPLNTVNTLRLNNEKTVVVVRAMQLDHVVNNINSKCLGGITSMILCVPNFSDFSGEVSFCQNLMRFLDGCSVLYSYPLFIFYCGPSQNLERFLSLLNEKFGADYFSEIKAECLSEVKQFVKNSTEVLKAIDWLLEKKFSPPALKKCDFGYYVEKCIAFAFNSLYWKCSLDGYKGLAMMPKQIIAFYNNVVTFRADILCSDLLMSIALSWPPEELVELYPDFKVIDEKAQYKFQESMKQMLLPPFEGDAFSIEDVWHYVEKIDGLAGKCSDRDSLYAKINEVLEISHWRDINWLQIIGICALHLVFSQNLELLDSEHVYYTEEDIEAFEEEKFWQNVLADVKKSLIIGRKRKEHVTHESPQKKKRTDKIIEIVPYHATPATVTLTEQKGISNAFDVPDIFSCQRKNLFGPVEAAVAKQKEQTESFFHLLNESIISGNICAGKDNDIEINCSSEVKLSNHEEFDSLTDTGANFAQSSTNLGTPFKTGVDWLDSTLTKKSCHEKSIFAIADKISELKYNIQKSNILEDHFSQLLSKQV